MNNGYRNPKSTKPAVPILVGHNPLGELEIVPNSTAAIAAL